MTTSKTETTSEVATDFLFRETAAVTVFVLVTGLGGSGAGLAEALPVLSRADRRMDPMEAMLWNCPWGNNDVAVLHKVERTTG